MIAGRLADAWDNKWRARLTPRALRRMALGLVIGLIGALIAEWGGVPLAWMLGPVFFCMAASLAGLPAEVPMWMRSNFMIFIGLFLGESFDGLTWGALSQWPVSIAGAALYLPLAISAAYFYYRHIARELPMTALCSSIPGGLSAIIVISDALGADERNVALAQSLRIALVVCMAPFVAFVIMGYAAAEDGGLSGQKLISLPDLALLLGVSFALMVVLRRSGIPILALVCPLIAAAILRPLGLVEGVLPHWLVEIGLLVLGASVGGRFAGVSWSRVFGFGAITFGGTSILMAVAGVLAWCVSAITGQNLVDLLLAYAPGGVAEMSLIAFAIDADPGFVAVHHLVRIAFVMTLIPVMVAWFGSKARA
ncbi:MAG: AbrB family transcriptional regulator [Pseudomonadota bacterium]